MDENPYERIDRIMNDRRLDPELDLDWKQLAEQAGISVQTLDAIRKGRNRPTERTWRNVCRVLRWNSISFEDFLAGGDPTPIDNGDQPDLHAVPGVADEVLEALKRDVLAHRARLQQLEAAIDEALRGRETDRGH